jgi:hypothetical protein
MPFFSRPRHSMAVERRHVGYLPAFGFLRLPRRVPRRLLEVYQSSSQWSVKSGSSTLQKRQSVNPLEHTAGCETGWAIDAFAVNSSFLSVDGMTYLIPFESWRIDLSNGISHIHIGQIVSIFRL